LLSIVIIVDPTSGVAVMLPSPLIAVVKPTGSGVAPPLIFHVPDSAVEPQGAEMIRYRVPYAEKRRAHCLLARHCGGALDLVLVAAHRQRAQLSRSGQPGVDGDQPGL
jgi:hypothetical protein